MGNVESDVESVLEGVARLSVVGGGREEGEEGGGGGGLDGDKMEEVESGDKMEEGEGGDKMEEGGKRGERSNSPYSVPEQEPHLTPTATHRKKTTFLLGYGGLTLAATCSIIYTLPKCDFSDLLRCKIDCIPCRSEPTRLDHDVYLAVRGDPCLSAYPHVVGWVHRVEGFSEHTQNRYVVSTYTCA